MRGAEERSGGGPKEKSASDKSLGDKGPAEKSAADERRGKNDKQAGDHKRDDKMQRSEGERGDRGKDSSATGAGSGESGSADRSTSSSSSKTSVHLSNEQRTKVQTVFRGHKSASVNVNIDARVGVAVPRSVTLVAVPEDIVVLVPEWRRYRYIVIGDTVCIVDPDTYEIIDVIVVS